MFKMRALPYIRIIKNKIFPNEVLYAYGTSSQPAVTSKENEEEKILKEFDTLINIKRKPRTKKPQRAPFVKNFLIGQFDTDILTYPELERDDVSNLEKNVKLVKKLLKQNHMVDATTLSDKQFRQSLSDYKLIGLQASQFLDGRECNLSESMHYLEALSEHNLRDSLVINEQLSIQTLVKFASDDLQKKYLYPAMKGEVLGAFCWNEQTSPCVTSKAEQRPDGKAWILNGEKAWVVNGISPDFYIVFAITKTSKTPSGLQEKLSAFIVDKNSSGITVQVIKDSDFEIANVKFGNTPVPNENVIGEINGGESMLTSIISEYRLSVGPMCISLTKMILNKLTQDIISRSNKENPLYDMDGVKGSIANLTSLLYATESATYLTSGLIDSYENQDCVIECAITKVFAADTALTAAQTSLEFIGLPAFLKSHWCNRCLKETLPYVTLHDSNNRLKIIIALLCLQHAGAATQETITKIRNPFYNSFFNFKRYFTDKRNVNDDPKLDMRLGDYLHPALLTASEQLEYCVKRIAFATEILLVRHGPEIVNFHIELQRLADCIIAAYVITASLGRASRSYCIGLRNADHEMLIASTLANSLSEMVKYNVQKIAWGPFVTNDENYRAIGKKLLNVKEYHVEHPLARNF